jgi:hypothetical protein
LDLEKTDNKVPVESKNLEMTAPRQEEVVIPICPAPDSPPRNVFRAEESVESMSKLMDERLVEAAVPATIGRRNTI